MNSNLAKISTKDYDSNDSLPKHRLPITAFVVCYNEEDQIKECLDTISFCDEIIIIDSFSSDSTVNIAKACGAKIFQRPWPGYKEQKAFGLSMASNEWVINLDADERVTEELREEILKVLEIAWQAKNNGQQPEADGYEFSRVVYYMGRWWRKGGWYPEYRLRLLRKSKTVWGGTDPHEKPIVTGTIKRLSGELSHFTYDDLTDHISRLHRHATDAAREVSAKKRKPNLWRLLVNPLNRAFIFYFRKRGYREGIAGLIVAILEGYYTFLKYALAMESSLNRSNPEDIKGSS